MLRSLGGASFSELLLEFVTAVFFPIVVVMLLVDIYT